MFIDFLNSLKVSVKLILCAIMFLLPLGILIFSHGFYFSPFLLAAIITSLLAYVMLFITILNIKKSADKVENVLKKLDNNDLSANTEPSSYDEFGRILAYLNNFLHKLKAVISSVNNNTGLVSTAVQELTSSAKEMTATANEQSASVAEIVSTMENNKNLCSQTADKTIEVADMASKTQELSQKGANLRDINENMMLDIRNQNHKIIEIIKNLSDMLFRIDESIMLIDTIADHTKLIAFNAALEASSSGEAGMRFSVVAAEIRRFADNVVESASEIKIRISEIQEAALMLSAEANNGSNVIDSSYKRMVEQKEVFENIVEVSQNVAVHSQQISSLSKQQEIASAQVFLALKEISAGVNQFAAVTTFTSNTLEKLNNMSVELEETLLKYNLKDNGNS